jgi:seryl-tRNA synthetase
MQFYRSIQFYLQHILFRSYRKMLIVSEIRSNFQDYIQGLQKRGINEASEILQKAIELDEQRKTVQQGLDDKLAQANQMSRQIGEFMKQGNKEAAAEIKNKTSQLKSQTKSDEVALKSITEALQEHLYNIPNIPNHLVPAGKSESDNEVIKSGGPQVDLPDNALPHWELIKTYDIVDFDLGNKVTGAGFPFYKGAGARLIRSMVNYFLDKGIEAGYMEVQPPVLINEDSGFGTGQLPDKEGQMYHIEDTNLYLIPTAEVPITNIYRDVILDQNQLPLKNIGYTPCFRREAGSWGAHVRGLNRLHQFDKVEIVQIVDPKESYDVLKQMIQHVEELVASLELPYRILRLCGGDLGFTSALTYDFEVFSAAQEKWLEVSSVSNFESYQANRLKLRFKNDEGKKTLAHTLNGSALALPRIMAAILENNQSNNGIRIPQVLQAYMNTDVIQKPDI